MMSPTRTNRFPNFFGSGYHPARPASSDDYSYLMALCRVAFDARRQYKGMENLLFDTFVNARIGMDNDGVFLRLIVNQYQKIDTWRSVTEEEALQYLMIEVERENRWRADIDAKLHKWGFYGL